MASIWIRRSVVGTIAGTVTITDAATYLKEHKDEDQDT